MTVTTAIAIYFLTWWITLFVVLPFGVRRQDEDGDIALGTDPGAPAMPQVGKKLIWTTLVSGVFFGVFYGVYEFRLLPFDRLAGWLSLSP